MASRNNFSCTKNNCELQTHTGTRRLYIPCLPQFALQADTYPLEQWIVGIVLELHPFLVLELKPNK